eukprot:791874-Rhodomonas_salina.1
MMRRLPPRAKTMLLRALQVNDFKTPTLKALLGQFMHEQVRSCCWREKGREGRGEGDRQGDGGRGSEGGRTLVILTLALAPPLPHSFHCSRLLSLPRSRSLAVLAPALFLSPFLLSSSSLLLLISSSPHLFLPILLVSSSQGAKASDIASMDKYYK